MHGVSTVFVQDIYGRRKYHGGSLPGTLPAYFLHQPTVFRTRERRIQSQNPLTIKVHPWSSRLENAGGQRHSYDSAPGRAIGDTNRATVCMDNRTDESKSKTVTW